MTVPVTVRNATASLASIRSCVTASTIAVRLAPSITNTAKNAAIKAASALTDNSYPRTGMWSLVGLHFQFQAVIIQPLTVANGAGQAACFDPCSIPRPPPDFNLPAAI